MNPLRHSKRFSAFFQKYLQKKSLNYHFGVIHAKTFFSRY